MIISAWHVVWAAITQTVTQMGMTLLGISASIIVLIVGLVIVFKRDGMTAVRVHWKKNIVVVLLPICAIWGGVVIYNVVEMIYSDHVRERNALERLATALESSNDLFKDAEIEWDGRGDVTFVFTALRSGDDLHVYLDLRQGSNVLGESYLFGGQPSKQPRVEIGTISHFVRDERLKVTLAAVSHVEGGQMVFQWGAKKYQNYAVGVNYGDYIGRIVAVEKSGPKEYHSYFVVVPRTFFDEKSNSAVLGPAFIVGPSVLRVIKNWDAT
ncbi:hypothetical protein [Paraburkholderia aspalathi]|uniref:Uncharacterized protein n=1 Tax=Paraburkholderia aspalathi TaxID=1324617 RepID=A0A1I7EED8_9BURK|nr:hypothetical protein [Paraburkholderia aspalathi]SFU22300.1 hypothetical protein SAMN05192563_10184 [Paraburkholderia aspalathi]